jgi:hypothetical protein
VKRFTGASLTRDFRLQVFFINQCPWAPYWGLFEFFRKLAEIFANECLSSVSTTPAINLGKRTPWRWEAVKDRRKLKKTKWRYLRPPKSDTAANGVIGTAMKRRTHRHTSWSEAPEAAKTKWHSQISRHKAEILPFGFEVVRAALEASDLGVWGV